ncbi:MAG: hypothetical protein ACREEM_39880 [Blastocatellia bacterium]
MAAKFWITLIALSPLVFPNLSSLQSQNQKREVKLIRLPPSAFRELPPEIVASLEKRGCLVPQYWRDRPPHNVIKGEFLRKGRKDWAVLCSRKGSSSILVFWNGNTQSVSEIAGSKDETYMQTDGGTNLVYSRYISPVGRTYILDHYRSYEGPKPAVITHQGIDDAFMGKGSTIHYRYRGKWLELPGAD